MAQPAAPAPVPRATAATGDTATCTPSPAPQPVPAPRLSLTSAAWWQGGIFGRCPAQVGVCARWGMNPNPAHPSPGVPEPPLWLSPADLPRRSVQLRVRTLQNATAGEVNGTVCHQRGWARGGGRTGTLASMAAWGACASMHPPPVGSLVIQQIHRAGGRQRQSHDAGCGCGYVPGPQRTNERPERPLGLGHGACIALQPLSTPVQSCPPLTPSHSPHHRSQPSWTPWR